MLQMVEIIIVIMAGGQTWLTKCEKHCRQKRTTIQFQIDYNRYRIDSSVFSWISWHSVFLKNSWAIIKKYSSRIHYTKHSSIQMIWMHREMAFSSHLVALLVLIFPYCWIDKWLNNNWNKLNPNRITHSMIHFPIQKFKLMDTKIEQIIEHQFNRINKII